MSNYVFLLFLILVCPLVMFWMMRGMHRGRGGSADGGHAQGHDHIDSGAKLEQLRQQREQLDREIEAHEAEEEAPAPAGRDWR